MDAEKIRPPLKKLTKATGGSLFEKFNPILEN
jgi:hypothetical protein